MHDTAADNANVLPDNVIHVSHRIAAIAANAMRESLLAAGREIWTDDDARRCKMVETLLTVPRLEDISMKNEHYPVVSAKQTPANPAMDAAEEAVRKALEPEKTPA